VRTKGVLRNKGMLAGGAAGAQKEMPAETGSQGRAAIPAGKSRHNSGKVSCGDRCSPQCAVIAENERQPCPALSKPKGTPHARPHFRAGTGFAFTPKSNI
jgi:hypothetical protein